MTIPVEEVPAFTCRLATPDDATDILDVLEEIADEVPVLLNTPQRLDAMPTIIIQSYDSRAVGGC